ncbi:MAG: hypothetical protein JWM05_693 [Acidimicrobiales bacterium]|nr:hypothetical protein [Acidimicrobiales bacterium]
MSPVARSGGHAGRALIVATIGVIVTMGALFLASLGLSNRNSAQVGLGDQTFRAGRTDDLAAAIVQRGPILYGDVSGAKDRDMILQHLGTNPDAGWYAFLAAPPDKPRSCTWQWQPSRHRFRAKCDHARTAPADGSGLPQFQVTVAGGRLEVDLNADRRAAATTTTTAATPTTTRPGG